MRVTVTGETELVISPAAEGLEIEEEGEGHFGPLEMLAASLGICTVSVLYLWAEQAALPTEKLEVVVRWNYVDGPYRVGRYEVTILWPGLAEKRREAALRVAVKCTVHNTLVHPPAVELRVAG
ncbi:MAG: OsmC family protein [Gemmatimonadota bacterium]